MPVFLLPVFLLFVSCNKQNSLQMFLFRQQSSTNETQSTFFIATSQQENNVPPAENNGSDTQSSATKKIKKSVSFADINGLGADPHV
ncbi:hypothetical protein [Cardinium endosymbiont of Tipula unca]|uniref:hypothetical protein n=1 Tax=Cardinium endosymbiont of Tipula unca TaxID=3066216 RepID=UPI0030D58D96